jgi:UDP:flavonoid glycosyltransferase YjiC (YdhE family)
MSRFLLTWELGMNLGHLARLVPIATRLKVEGHSVLVAVRETPAAASVLGPAGIPFVQAPHLPRGMPLPDRASGYADILLSQGWSDPQVLWGLTQTWHNLLRMFRPDVVVADYSPTARLATLIAGIPTVLLGNGFELPPLTDPLPHFPGFSWATAEKAAVSERSAVDNANAVLARFKRPPIHSLSHLFRDVPALFVTFPELDHYGPREHANYVGPLLGGIRGQKIDWPNGSRRIFACLRPDTNQVTAILEALRLSDAAVVCYAPGFAGDQLKGFAGDRMLFTSRPVDIFHLSADADVCVSYGAEGTIATFLLAGVPQLVSPWHVEAHMAARRIEALGAATVMRGAQDEQSISRALAHVCMDAQLKQCARAFASRHRNLDFNRTAQQVAETIEAAPKADVTSHEESLSCA